MDEKNTKGTYQYYPDYDSNLLPKNIKEILESGNQEEIERVQEECANNEHHKYHRSKVESDLSTTSTIFYCQKCGCKLEIQSSGKKIIPSNIGSLEDIQM